MKALVETKKMRPSELKNVEPVTRYRGLKMIKNDEMQWPYHRSPIKPKSSFHISVFFFLKFEERQKNETLPTSFC